jgi:hypothetical protein
MSRGVEGGGYATGFSISWCHTRLAGCAPVTHQDSGTRGPPPKGPRPRCPCRAAENRRCPATSMRRGTGSVAPRRVQPRSRSPQRRILVHGRLRCLIGSEGRDLAGRQPRHERPVVSHGSSFRQRRGRHRRGPSRAGWSRQPAPRLGVDVARGEQLQPQPVCQPARIREIIAVLEPGIGADRGRVRQVHPVASLHQTVHQPAPVVGGFHDEPLQLRGERRQCPQDRGQIIAQASLEESSVRLILDHHHAVVGRQVNAAVESPQGLLVELRSVGGLPHPP